MARSGTSLHYRRGRDAAAPATEPGATDIDALRPRPGTADTDGRGVPGSPDGSPGGPAPAGGGGEEEPGRLRRLYQAVKFPPPTDSPIFTSRSQGAAYLGAWLLTVAHVTLWILVACKVLGSTRLEIGMGVLSFVATCLLIWMVIATHRRLEVRHGGTARHLATVWWRGPWDPVGRQVWLPVKVGAAVQATRTGTTAQ